MNFHSRRLSHRALAVALLAASLVASAGAGCSLKSRDTHSIRIGLPERSAAATVESASHRNQFGHPLLDRSSSSVKIQNSSNFVAPTSLDSFTCYAINVTGDGIPNNPNLQCLNTNDSPGILGGFVPLDAGFIEVDVPAGSGRRIQLVAVQSTVGCPSLNDLITSTDHNQFNGIGDPYQVGSAVTDITDDTTVQIVASYVPGVNPQVFKRCDSSSNSGGGPYVPMTAAFLGFVPVPSPPANQLSLPFSIAPSALANAPELNGTAMTLNQLATLPDDTCAPNHGQCSPSSPVSTSIKGTAGIGKRGTIQFQFDLTGFDLATYPLFKFDTYMQGGSSCTGMGSPNNVQSAVYSGRDSAWIPIGYNSGMGGGSGWGFGGTGKTTSALNISDLVFVKGGAPYLIINVETNFVSEDATCESFVGVGGTTLQLRSLPDTSQNYSQPLTIQSTLGANGMAGPGSGQTFFMASGGTTRFGASGGTPPYTFSVAAGGGTMDAVTGVFTASTGDATTSVIVTDDAGAVVTAAVHYSTQTVLGMAIGNFTAQETAGTCYAFDARAVDTNGATSTSHPTFIFHLSSCTEGMNGGGCGPQVGTFYHNTSDCSALINPITDTTSVTLSSGTGFVSLYFRPLQATPQGGNGSSSTTINANPDPTANLFFQGTANLTVTAAAVHEARLFGPGMVNANACIPYTVALSDAFGNHLANSFGDYQADFGGVGTLGVFNDSACTGVINHITVPASSTDLTVYVKDTAPEIETVNVAIDGTGPPAPPAPLTGLSNGATPITVLAAGAATALKLAGTSTTIFTCDPYSVSLVDSTGATATSSPTNVHVYLNVGGAGVYSDGGCTTHLSANGSPMVVIPGGGGAQTVNFFVLSGNPGGRHLDAYVQTGLGYDYLTHSSLDQNLTGDPNSVTRTPKYARLVNTGGTINPGACVGLDLRLTDQFDDPIATGGSLTVNFGTVSGTGYVFPTGACGSPTTTANIPGGQNHVTVYYKNPSSGTTTFAATGTNLISTNSSLVTALTAPANLHYLISNMVLTSSTQIVPNYPLYTGGSPTSFSVNPALPAGLSLNGTAGSISGTPTATAAPATFTVTASNGAGSTQTTLGLQVQPNDSGRAFSASCSFSMVHWAHFATLLQSGLVLIGAGYDSSQVATTTAELYNPASDTCLGTGPMVAGRADSAFSVLLTNGKVLVGGGSGGLASAELYDPGSGTFSATGSMTVGRQYAQAVLLQSGKVLVVGGQDSGSVPLTSAELYDPAAGTFSATGSMSSSRGTGHSVTNLPNGKVLVAGGEYGGGTNVRNDAEIYDPGASTFSPATNTMSSSRTWHTALLLPNGKVLVAGGHYISGGGGTLVASADLYDYTTNTFATTGSLDVPRDRGEGPGAGGSVLLPNGKVLIAGSAQDGCVAALSTSELYDPTTGTFSWGPNLGTARVYHQATLLPNGKVLISAGKDTTCGSTWGNMLSTTELFQ